METPGSHRIEHARQKPGRASAIQSTLLMLLLAVIGPACGPKKRPPLPPGPSSTPTQPTSGGTASPADRRTPPEIQVSLAPSQIQRGESVLLAWTSRYASRVVIEPGVGEVDAIGQVRLFPEQTTSYEVTAIGPGGAVSRSVTAQVLDSEARIDSTDISTAPLAPIEERFPLAVKPIFFEFDSAELLPEARRVLDENAEWLLLDENTGVRFLIEGHCDARGTEEYNLALGDRRANAARDYLVAKGLGPSLILTVSFGEERLFESGDGEEAHALNRRAHFVLLRNP